MSINIPGSLVEVSSSITAVVDTNRFGPRQTETCLRALRTGVIRGGGLPSLIAKHLRLHKGLPVVHMATNSVQWHNLTPDSDGFRYLQGLAAEMALQYTPRSDGYRDYTQESIDDIFAAVRTCRPTGYGYNHFRGLHHAKPAVLNKVKLPLLDCSTLPAYITLDLSKGAHLFWTAS